MAISILYPHRKFWRSLYGTNFLEISNGRKTVRMAPILTIFGPNESQRCQLNFEKILGRRKNFHEGEKFEKLSRKVRKILPRTRFLGRNKIETAIFQTSHYQSTKMEPSENARWCSLDGVKPFWKKVPIKIGMSIAIAIGFVFLKFFIWGASWKNREKQSHWQWQCSCQFWLVLFGTFFQNGFPHLAFPMYPFPIPQLISGTLPLPAAP